MPSLNNLAAVTTAGGMTLYANAAAAHDAWLTLTGDAANPDGTAVIAEKDIPRFTGDADGIATIPIAKSGPHLLVIDHRVAPLATPDQANADLHTATLWFSVGGKHVDVISPEGECY